mmetsp:Transcript_4512/g.8006  ORF Transcript_4512/g.8006 Transcript_4512/m.8006 type:complete len:129 (+) Transcript_4512:1439-1825(+)
MPLAFVFSCCTCIQTGFVDYIPTYWAMTANDEILLGYGKSHPTMVCTRNASHWLCLVTGNCAPGILTSPTAATGLIQHDLSGSPIQFCHFPPLSCCILANISIICLCFSISGLTCLGLSTLSMISCTA